MTIFPPDPNLTALRVELARLRGERGWTFDELAERSGVSAASIETAVDQFAEGRKTIWF